MRLRSLRAMVALAAVAMLSGCGVHVEFSPDGKKLLVSDGNGPIMIVNADGSQPRHLPGTRGAFSAIWGPDGHYILYEASQEGQEDWKVFLYDLRTKSARAFPGHLSAPYTFSDDGRQVVAWDKRKACLVWLDVPSGERLLAVPCPATPTDVRLHWLPDRHGVAFIGQKEKEGADVYTVEAGKVYRISTTHDVVGLGVSPDGKRLLWARQTGHDANATVTTFAYDLDARTVQKLPLQVRVRDLMHVRLPRNTALLTEAEFSPDGKSIALQVTCYRMREKFVVEETYCQGAFVLPLSGGRVTKIFASARPGVLAEAISQMAWSPRAERVVLVTSWKKKVGHREEEVWRVRVMRPEGNEQRIIDL